MGILVSPNNIRLIWKLPQCPCKLRFSPAGPHICCHRNLAIKTPIGKLPPLKLKPSTQTLGCLGDVCGDLGGELPEFFRTCPPPQYNPISPILPLYNPYNPNSSHCVFHCHPVNLQPQALDRLVVSSKECLIWTGIWEGPFHEVLFEWQVIEGTNVERDSLPVQRRKPLTFKGLEVRAQGKRYLKVHGQTCFEVHQYRV